jgi:hypothetical protein
MMKKHKQGTLDGLCGIYAVVIACRGVMSRSSEERKKHTEYHKRLYEACCKSVTTWPRTLWEGLDFDALIEMIENAQRLEPEIFQSISVSYPFAKKEPATSENYWIEFKKLFDDDPKGFALIGMSKPDEHWLVVRRKTDKQLEIIDPSPLREAKCKNISDIHAGPNKLSKKTWQIQRNELVFFTRKKV